MATDETLSYVPEIIWVQPSLVGVFTYQKVYDNNVEYVRSDVAMKFQATLMKIVSIHRDTIAKLESEIAMLRKSLADAEELLVDEGYYVTNGEDIIVKGHKHNRR